MAQRLLGALGYQVIAAASGEEALRLYGEQSQRVDLVILDLHLADRSGTDVLRAAAAAQPRGQGAAQLRAGPREARARLLEHGARGFLAKPYGMEEVAEGDPAGARQLLISCAPELPISAGAVGSARWRGAAPGCTTSSAGSGRGWRTCSSQVAELRG